MVLGALIFGQRVILREEGHTTGRRAERIEEGKGPSAPWAFLSRH